MADPKATRYGYSDGLLELGAKDPRIVALDGDLAKSTSSNRFQEKFPDRFFEMGIAEQNMVGVAAGLAIAGKIPFASSYSVFVTGRAWEQMRTMVAYSNLNVNIGGHAGISVGPDGATHQALEDIAIMASIPNMTVLVPCDHIETKKATMAAAYRPGPAYIRFGRAPVPTITDNSTPFEIGKANIIKTGKDLTIVTNGVMVYESMKASEELAKLGIDCEIINMHTVKPLDMATLLSSAKKTGKVLVAEEHQINGGLCSIVAMALGKELPVPMGFVAMADRFGESGEPEELLAHFKCNCDEIISVAKQLAKK